MAASLTLGLCLVALCFVSFADADYYWGHWYRRSNKTEDLINYAESGLVRGGSYVLAFTRSRPYSKSTISRVQDVYTKAVKDIDNLMDRLKGAKVSEAEKSADQIWAMVTQETKVDKATFDKDLKKFEVDVKKTSYTRTPESVRKVLEQLRKMIEKMDCRRLVAYRILLNAHKQAPMPTGCDVKAELVLTLRRVRPVAIVLRDYAGKIKNAIPDRVPYHFHFYHYGYHY